MGAAENSRCGCSQKTRLYGHTTVVVVVLIELVVDVVVSALAAGRKFN